jgi:hypothetical protein
MRERAHDMYSSLLMPYAIFDTPFAGRPASASHARYGWLLLPAT